MPEKAKKVENEDKERAREKARRRSRRKQNGKTQEPKHETCESGDVQPEAKRFEDATQQAAPLFFFSSEEKNEECPLSLTQWVVLSSKPGLDASKQREKELYPTHK